MTDPTPAATARDALGYAIHAAICPRLGRPCSGAHALPDADAILAALPDGWTLAAAPSEFLTLVDEARANHVRWEHEAEVLEECIRPLCIGAKVLLWPDIENPRTSALAVAEAPGRVAALEAEPCHATMLCPYPQDHPIHAEDGDHDYAPAPTPSEPVARFTGQDEWPCVCGHVKRRHHFGDTPAIDGSFGAWCQADPMHCVRFTPGARDE